MQSVKLLSGHTMPTVGLGVYRSNPGDETYHAVASALKLGYRHVDTAQVYNNEGDVGRAVRECGIPREELFVTTKLWRSEWGYERATTAIAASLKRLGLAYIDLLLLHCPGDPGMRAATWKALEDAMAKGLVRSIGVSNFGPAHLDKLLTTARVVPAVNQVEIHPWLQRRDLVDYCKGRGIVVEAYSPLAKATKLQDSQLLALAARVGVSPAQVLLRWSLQHGLVPLPKSVSPQRQATNLAVFGFTLSEGEMAQMDSWEEGLVTGWDPIRDDPV